MLCYYSPRVDWWIYAIVIFTGAGCMLGPILTHDGYWLGAISGVLFVSFEVFTFASIKYAVRGRELGVRQFYRWYWFPIDKISEIKAVKGILSAPSLSVHRLAVKFTDRNILKSSAPLEISPRDRDGFMAALVAINPHIHIK